MSRQPLRRVCPWFPDAPAYRHDGKAWHSHDGIGLCRGPLEARP